MILTDFFKVSDRRKPKKIQIKQETQSNSTITHHSIYYVTYLLIREIIRLLDVFNIIAL